MMILGFFLKSYKNKYQFIFKNKLKTYLINERNKSFMLRMLLILIFIDWNKYLKKKRTEKDIVKLQATSISLFLINQLLQTAKQPFS